MQDSVTLPQWLDYLIFEELGAKYCRSNSDMTVIDWDKNDVLNYLGTYFPRSYAESYCIFTEFFRTYTNRYIEKTELTVFDFGCGTGGEIIGLLSAISECLPQINNVHVVAMDGNYHALRLYERVLVEYNTPTRIEISNRVVPLTIDDFYDLKVLDRVLTEKFDIVMTFKAICEFVTKDKFEKQNPYAHITNAFVPKLSSNGIMLIVDVSTYNNVSREWLPRMLDAGLTQADCNILFRNGGYNQSIFISHSKQNGDVSKVAWRIIEKKINPNKKNWFIPYEKMDS